MIRLWLQQMAGWCMRAQVCAATGHLVILKHNNTYLTAYAHNQKLLVKEDQNVKKGQKIAEMGNTDADRVKLHFEVRRQGKPVRSFALFASTLSSLRLGLRAKCPVRSASGIFFGFW